MIGSTDLICQPGCLGSEEIPFLEDKSISGSKRDLGISSGLIPSVSEHKRYQTTSKWSVGNRTEKFSAHGKATRSTSITRWEAGPRESQIFPWV